MRLKTQPLPCPAQAVSANALALGAIVLLPLYMANGYIGLVDGKFWLLLVLAAAGLAAALAGRLFDRRGGLARPLPRPQWAWLPLPVLCLAYTAAWWFSEDRTTALWGLTGRKNGLILLLACTVLYFTVLLFGGGLPLGLACGALVLTGCAATVVSWANFFLLDPLDAYYTLLPAAGSLFLGPLGNLNFYGAFLDLCLPVALWQCMTATTRRPARLWGAGAAFLATGLICAGSDAAWLGAAVGVAALCCGRWCRGRQLSRACAALAAAALAAPLVGALARVLPLRGDGLRTVSRLVTLPLPGLGLAAGLALAAFVLHRAPECPAWRGVRGLALAAAAAAVGLFALANLTAVPLGPLEPLLRFNERWASNRGFAWQRLWTVYTEDFTPLQKLFGVGGDGAAHLLKIDDYSVQFMQLLNGSTFDSAHNEFLQHLICGGAVGLLAWAAFLALHIRRGLASAPGFGAAIAAYAAQSAFSISMPGVFPLVFVLAALCLASPRRAPACPGRTVLAFLAASVPVLWAAGAFV